MKTRASRVRWLALAAVLASSGATADEYEDPPEQTAAQRRAEAKLERRVKQITLSARVCAYNLLIRSKRAKPLSDIGPLGDLRASLSGSRRRLAEMAVPPMPCADRLVKGAMACLGSVWGDDIPVDCGMSPVSAFRDADSATPSDGPAEGQPPPPPVPDKSQLLDVGQECSKELAALEAAPFVQKVAARSEWFKCKERVLKENEARQPSSPP